MTSARDVDETRELRIPLRAPLVWDNVTCSKQYVFGVRPVYSHAEQLCYVTIPPGESIDFLVPDHEMIRVDALDSCPVSEAQLEIWSSDGSGMYRKLVPAYSTDGSTMIAAPDSSGYSVAKVYLPDYAASPVRVSVFTSRRTALQVQDFYQCRIDGCGEQVEISQSGATERRRYNFVTGTNRHTLKVEGPVRLRFESRLKYDADSQPERSSWINVYVDEVLHRILLFDTMPHRSSRTFVGDCERVIGRKEYAYLDLDCDDHDVAIEVSHSMYLRIEATGLNLARPRLNSSFNLTAVASPEQPVSIWNAPDYDPSAVHLSRAFMSGDDGRPQFELDPVMDPYLNQQTIQKLARDNSVPYSGLRAYMWMRAIATHHYSDADYRNEVSVSQMARRIRGRFTVFRDLQPFETESGVQPRTVAFSARSVRRPNQQSTIASVGEQHVADFSSSLSRVTTFPLSASGQAGNPGDELVYRPPSDLGPSVLRLIVDQTHLHQAAVLEVQYDDNLPVEMAVVRDSTLAPDMRVPGGTEAALAGLACVHSPYDSATFGGPFSMLNQPVGIIRAATAELLLPARVQNVKVRVKSGEGQPVHVGLQYLTSRYQQLSESSYRRHVESASSATGHSQEFSWRELDNDSTRLRQLLHSNWLTVGSSVEPTVVLEEPTSVMNDELVDAEFQRAAEFARLGQWTSAVESLSLLVRHSLDDRRRNAILSRANALESAGEFFLAGRERLGWLVHSGDERLRQEMLQQLVDESSSRPHGDALVERYLSYAVMEFDDPAAELSLARQFMHNGKYRMALLTLPVDVSGPEVDEILLRCSFQLQWWKTFEETLRRIDDPVQANLWQGLKALRTGDYERARRLLESAGPQGLLWLDHWMQGDEVFGELTSTDVARRLSAVTNWERWQAEHPGPRVWRPEASTVKSCAGAANLLSVALGTSSRYFRSKKQSASVIRIHGPVRIRIEGRPVHRRDREERLDDWLTITNGNQVERVPILNNRPSDSLKIEGYSELLPGQRVFAEFDLPAGLNELQLSTLESDLLFRVYAQRPEMASPVLPPVNETTLAAVIKGCYARVGRCEVSGSRNQIDDSVRLVCLDKTCCSAGLDYTNLLEQCSPLHSVVDCYDELRFGDARDWQDRVIPSPLPFVNLQQDENYREAISLLRQSEGSTTPGDNSRLRQIAELEKILVTEPDRRDVRELVEKLKAGFKWRRLKQFDSRAGTRDVSVEGWQPESPAQRIRRALAQPTGSDYVLTGTNDLAMGVNDTRWTEFLISVQQPSIGFVSLADASVIWHAAADSGEVKLQGPDIPAEFSVHLPPGSNTLQIKHGQPLSNHLLRVRIHEVMPDGSVVEIGTSRMNAGESRREYTVATHDEPLRFRIAGPAVIRVDKNKDGSVRSEIIPVVEDQRAFELLPAFDEETALYRVHQLVADDQPLDTYRPEPLLSRPPAHWSDGVVQAVYEEVEFNEREALEQLSLRRPDALPSFFEIEESSNSGNLSMGTIGLHFGYMQRRALNEFPSSGTPGRFFEAKVSRHRFDPWSQRYVTNEFLIRPRLETGPTYGLIHRGELSLPWQNILDGRPVNGRGPFRFTWKASAYAQYAGTPLIPPTTSMPGSLNFSASLSRAISVTERLSRRPGIQLYARALSEDFNRFSAGELDQDVFTQYKSDHPYGFRISDKLVYQRVMDRRIWIRPSATSNADQFTLDNIGFEAGTDQLMGPLHLHLSYRLTRFNADTHRGVSVLQNVFNIEAKFERWRNRNCRSDLAFSIQHDADDGGTSIGLNYSRFLNHGRGYRDLSPDSIIFGPVRQERFASQFIFDEN
ncbi:MAG: hypothetical protein AAF456_07750 [Planctomycetota bacterium]